MDIKNVPTLTSDDPFIVNDRVGPGFLALVVDSFSIDMLKEYRMLASSSQVG